jgi:hypothetical protein
MALVGGGGAGNVTGSNPSGTSSSIKFIGDHAYAYSGTVDVDNNETTLLDFSIGGSYVVAKFQPYNNYTGGTDSQFKIYLDEQLIMVTHMASSSTGTPFEEMELLIPSFTRLRITGKNATDSGTISVMGTITGRVYA